MIAAGYCSTCYQAVVLTSVFVDANSKMNNAGRWPQSNDPIREVKIFCHNRKIKLFSILPQKGITGIWATSVA